MMVREKGIDERWMLNGIFSYYMICIFCEVKIANGAIGGAGAVRLVNRVGS
jgi:hypothetical protein